MTDISRGGLGFRYLSPVDEENSEAEKFQMLDILLSGNGFYLPEIRCSLVYDEREDNGHDSFMLDLVNRRCGLKFGQLTGEQEKQINFFLEHHTGGTA